MFLVPGEPQGTFTGGSAKNLKYFTKEILFATPTGEEVANIFMTDGTLPTWWSHPRLVARVVPRPRGPAVEQLSGDPGASLPVCNTSVDSLFCLLPTCGAARGFWSLVAKLHFVDQRYSATNNEISFAEFRGVEKHGDNQFHFVHFVDISEADRSEGTRIDTFPSDSASSVSPRTRNKGTNATPFGGLHLRRELERHTRRERGRWDHVRFGTYARGKEVVVSGIYTGKDRKRPVHLPTTMAGKTSGAFDVHGEPRGQGWRTTALRSVQEVGKEFTGGTTLFDDGQEHCVLQGANHHQNSSPPHYRDRTPQYRVRERTPPTNSSTSSSPIIQTPDAQGIGTAEYTSVGIQLQSRSSPSCPGKMEYGQSTTKRSTEFQGRLQPVHHDDEGATQRHPWPCRHHREGTGVVVHGICGDTGESNRRPVPSHDEGTETESGMPQPQRARPLPTRAIAKKTQSNDSIIWFASPQNGICPSPWHGTAPQGNCRTDHEGDAKLCSSRETVSSQDGSHVLQDHRWSNTQGFSKTHHGVSGNRQLRHQNRAKKDCCETTSDRGGEGNAENRGELGYSDEGQPEGDPHRNLAQHPFLGILFQTSPRQCHEDNLQGDALQSYGIHSNKQGERRSRPYAYLESRPVCYGQSGQERALPRETFSHASSSLALPLLYCRREDVCGATLDGKRDSLVSPISLLAILSYPIPQGCSTRQKEYSYRHSSSERQVSWSSRTGMPAGVTCARENNRQYSRTSGPLARQAILESLADNEDERRKSQFRGLVFSWNPRATPSLSLTVANYPQILVHVRSLSDNQDGRNPSQMRLYQPVYQSRHQKVDHSCGTSNCNKVYSAQPPYACHGQTPSHCTGETWWAQVEHLQSHGVYCPRMHGVARVCNEVQCVSHRKGRYSHHSTTTYWMCYGWQRLQNRDQYPFGYRGGGPLGERGTIKTIGFLDRGLSDGTVAIGPSTSRRWYGSFLGILRQVHQGLVSSCMGRRARSYNRRIWNQSEILRHD